MEFHIPFTQRVLHLRHYTGQNWTNWELALGNHHNGGMAYRETALRGGWKCEEAIEAFGRDNPNDRYVTPEGNIVFGKISMTPDGGVHVISAEQVYALAVRKEALKLAIQQATEDPFVVSEPVTVTEPEPEPEAEATKPAAKSRRTPAARR